MDLLADTVFLIDLWRESASPGPATAYARNHALQQIAISWTVAGEFLSGALAARQDLDLVAAFLARYPMLDSNAAIVRAYASIYANLRATGQMIGPNDLWIAATARAHRIPLITRNAAEFRRVKDIEIVDYSAGA